MANDKKLWKAFSEFIRLRDADVNGIVNCFTCGTPRHWKKVDCGHGVGRQHKATKFNEFNNHGQCKRCNGFEEGRKDVYSKEVHRPYGKGTWDKLLLQSKQVCKRGQFEIDTMEKYYKEKVIELKELKGQ